MEFAISIKSSSQKFKMDMHSLKSYVNYSMPKYHALVYIAFPPVFYLYFVFLTTYWGCILIQLLIINSEEQIMDLNCMWCELQNRKEWNNLSHIWNKSWQTLKDWKSYATRKFHFNQKTYFAMFPKVKQIQHPQKIRVQRRHFGNGLKLFY